MSQSSADSPAKSVAPGDAAPRVRPRERFWPYAELPEAPTPEELAELDPDLYEALFGAPPRPFSFIVVFPRFGGGEYERAVELARASSDYRETGTGGDLRHRARYYPADIPALRRLYELVGAQEGCEVLVDDRPVPYARELWLPLAWLARRA